MTAKLEQEIAELRQQVHAKLCEHSAAKQVVNACKEKVPPPGVRAAARDTLRALQVLERRLHRAEKLLSRGALAVAYAAAVATKRTTNPTRPKTPTQQARFEKQMADLDTGLALQTLMGSRKPPNFIEPMKPAWGVEQAIDVDAVLQVVAVGPQEYMMAVAGVIDE